jgi:hypothetical protein
MAFDTFEEAFGYSAGLDYHEMSLVPSIRTAVYAYYDGNYEFPLEYFIVPGITPIRLPPPEPDQVLQWNIPQDHFSQSNIMLRRSRRRDRSTQTPTRPTSNRNDFELNVSFSTLEIGVNAGSHGQTRAPGTPSIRRNYTFSSQASTPTCVSERVPVPNDSPSTPAPAYTPLPRHSASGRPTTPPNQDQPSLSRHMVAYLTVHHHLSPRDIREIGRLFSSTQSNISRRTADNSFIPQLMEYGLSRTEATFFSSWAFDQ